MARPLRCWVRGHKWVKIHTPESIDPNPFYLRCDYCWKEHDLPVTQF